MSDFNKGGIMRSETTFRWAIGLSVLLAIALVIQGVLLWQTRQQLAALDPGLEMREQGSARDSEQELTPLEEKILARLEAKDPQPRSSLRQLSPGANSLFGGSLFSSDPFASFDQMRQRMDALMSGMGPASGMSLSLRSPDFQLQETEDDYRLLIKVPEQHEIDLQTEVEDREVIVRGSISSNRSQTGNGLSSQFVSSSQFNRRFDLPGDVNEVGVYTEQSNEGLVLVMPKAKNQSQV
ncbi:MAG: Hsp20 family protein [Pseudomonadales bacterium]|nr:Hsp20 family protein [Pseudomonadales bacterium]